MAEVSRNDDLGYPIFVGKNLRSAVADFARARGPASVLLCDANRQVLALGRKLAKALGSPPVLAFQLGETRKIGRAHV